MTVRGTDGGSPPRTTDVPVIVDLTSSTASLPPVWQDVGNDRIDDITYIVIPENITVNSKLNIELRAEVPGTKLMNINC